MKKIPYGRNEYGSRGRVPHQDVIADAMKARKCVICDARMYRLRYENGRLETWERFLRRLTCNKKCWSVWVRGKNNPNYKGIMPHCLHCKKPLNTYPLEGHQKGRFCKSCFDLLRTGVPRGKWEQHISTFEGSVVKG